MPYWSELVYIALCEDASFPVEDWGLAMAILTYRSCSSFISISFVRCCAGWTGYGPVCSSAVTRLSAARQGCFIFVWSLLP